MLQVTRKRFALRWLRLKRLCMGKPRPKPWHRRLEPMKSKPRRLFKRVPQTLLLLPSQLLSQTLRQRPNPCLKP
jgi:hypothetical protein